MKYNYDLLVIGAGSGGVRAARIASSHGANVAICEKDRLGGTCVIKGCIPKKLLVYGSQYKKLFKGSEKYGWSFNNLKHNWNKLIKNKNKELDRLEAIYEKLLLDADVDIYYGKAKFISKNSIEIEKKIITAKKVIIASGGYSKKLDVLGGELCIDSDDALELKKLPKKITIIGGGYIAIEFAFIFALLGSKVNILYRGKKILKNFDSDLTKMLEDAMGLVNINLITNVNIKKISLSKELYKVYFNSSRSISSNKVLSAIGRVPATKGIGLEKIGVNTGKDHSIIVNQNLSTSKKNIYAIGDVTNRINLTPVAIAEGHALADNLYSKKRKKIDLSNVGSAVFSTPALCSVGPTETEAVKVYKNVDIYESKFRPLKYTIINKTELIYVKLIVNRDNDRIIGAHMFGEEGPEVIQIIAVAIQAKATKTDFDNAMAIHPTVAEELVTLNNLTRSY